MNRSVILSRQLALVVYIERHPGIRVEELAKHFGLRPRVIRDDIEVLDRAGFGDLLPGSTFELNMDRYLETGELEVYSSLSVRSAPRLTSREAAVLLTGLRAIAPGLNEEQSAVVPSLIAEVLALAGGEGGAALNLTQVVESNLPSATWRTMEQAIRERKQVRIHYLSSAGRESERRIDPLRLERAELAWLLHAWCHQTDQARTFRLDRIIDAEPLDDPQDPGRIEARGPGETCDVMLRASARWRLGEEPVIDVESSSSGSSGDSLLRARFSVWDRQWMVTRLLSLAPDALATDPAFWQYEAGERAREALAVWDAVSDTPPESPEEQEGTIGDQH